MFMLESFEEFKTIKLVILVVVVQLEVIKLQLFIRGILVWLYQAFHMTVDVAVVGKRTSAELDILDIDFEFAQFF